MKIVSELDFAYYKMQSKDWKPQGQLTDVWLENEQSSYAPIEVELMQFTGLHDKNGREIYEGDIIAIYPRDTEFYGEKATFQVKTEHHPTFGYDTYFDSISGYFCATHIIEDNLENLEVIGNVFENPELLEGDTE